MYWLIPAAFGLGAGALAAWLLDEDSSNEYQMANCNKLFLDFNNEISLTPSKKTKLRSSRTSLEDLIRKKLGENENVTFKGFFIQGSMARTFDTAIIKNDGTYDVDLGVYLSVKPEVTCTTAQKYLYDAVKEHTDAGAQHFAKCIRVVYAGDFNVDLPLYYQEEGDDTPHIAIKNEDWRLDDPKGTSEWFKEKKANTDGQLQRVIKYLKAWCENLNFKTPSGFALTVWVSDDFDVTEGRDDKALLAALKAIKSSIVWGFTCPCPQEPGDNLVAKLDDTQEQKFREALEDFIEDAEAAISETNQLKASKHWRRHLGNDRFPLGKDEDIDAKEERLRKIADSILAGKAKTNSQGKIQEEAGVNNLPHRNYGE